MTITFTVVDGVVRRLVVALAVVVGARVVVLTVGFSVVVTFGLAVVVVVVVGRTVVGTSVVEVVDGSGTVV